MDAKLAFLGTLPPALAALAEWWTPVTRKAVRDRLDQDAATFRVDGGPDDLPAQIADFAAETAEGAAEASAIIPTWIGVTTGVLAAAADVLPPWWIALVSIIWTAACAIYAPRYFSEASYQTLATQHSASRLCRGKTKAECLSRVMIAADLVTIVIVLAVAASKPGEAAMHASQSPVDGRAESTALSQAPAPKARPTTGSNTPRPDRTTHGTAANLSDESSKAPAAVFTRAPPARARTGAASRGGVPPVPPSVPC